ncbi:MAG: histidine phosphatase family protein [Pseudomonadota bacterium]|nr:histidine phosphatase family protein [Pseudomonadota bacterium]
MPSQVVSLHRKPFLTPIWLSVLLALMVIVSLSFAAWYWSTADSTLIIVVRYAQDDHDRDTDPPLDAAGGRLAEALAGVFGSAGAPGRIDAIYVSQTLRARMTAAPLAAKLSLTPVVEAAADPRGLARRLLREHRGGKVLVVVREDTLPAIVAALTGSDRLAPNGRADGGAVYVVSVPRIGRADYLRLRL